MSASRDPIKDWAVQQYREIFGDIGVQTGDDQIGPDGRPTRIHRFAPVSLYLVVPAALALFADRIMPTVAGNATATGVLTHLHNARILLAAAAVALIACDVVRYRMHRWAQMLEAVVRQATGHLPSRVTVSFPPGLRVLRRATIRLHRGAVVRPKGAEELSRSVTAMFPRAAGAWDITSTHEAHRNRIVIARKRIVPDTRSERHKALQQALDAASILKEPKVTVADTDDNGAETGYRISFEQSLNAGARGFQAKVDEALAALAGAHESGRSWVTDWNPAEGHLVMRLVAAMPDRVDHPLALVDENLRHLPYATGAADLTMVWDISTRSNKPHCLIVGPTGGGKALDVATPIATPAGWTTMGELRVGDLVFDEAGQQCTVTAVYDQPLTDNCYEVTFSDGSTIVADGDHLWYTDDRAARISRSEQERAQDTRRRAAWLTPETVERLRRLAASAHPGEGITIPAAAALAGVDPTAPALHRIANSLGPIRTDRVVRNYNYGAQTVIQQQKVRVYDSERLADYLITRAARSRRGSLLAAHADTLTTVCGALRHTGEVTAADIAVATGLPTGTVRNWLPSRATLPPRIELRNVALNVPERVVTRPATPVQVHSRSGLLTAIANYGARPMRDQRHLRSLGQVRSTDQIRATLRTGDYVNHSVPIAQPLDLPDADLLIHPYTLGAWLGDGTSCAPYITSADPEIVDRIRDDGYPVQLMPRAVDASTKCRSYRIDGLRPQLRQLGLLHTGRGTSKRIPLQYLRASEQQRRDLLAGLLDTDGTVKPGGAVEYTTTRPQLAGGVSELALSLGYRAVVREGRARLDGRDIGPKWTITFTTTDAVFHLSRKTAVQIERTRNSNIERNRHRYITNVQKVTPRATRCITVDSPRSLFLAGPAMIPTHNTSVIRTLLTESARRGIPFVGVDPKMIELDGLEGYPGCGAIVYDAVRSAMFVRALHSEMMARNAYVHHNKIEPSQLPLMIAVLDEFFILSGKWQRLAKTGDEETREQIKTLDPLGAWADLAVLARSAGIRLLLGVQRPDAQLFGSSSGNARDNFGTRISLGNLSQDGALMMWGDAAVGREVDTSVPGRGVALGADGNPVDAQMWWTPNVDRHPNKWNQLSAAEKAIIEGLAPAAAPQFTCYSPELADFIESERARAKRARAHGAAPEPIVLGSGETVADTETAATEPAPTADEDDAAEDAIPAAAVTAGQTVLIDDEDGALVPVTVDAVDVVRDSATGDVIETQLTVTSGRVKTCITYGATGVVFLPTADPAA